MNLSTLYKIFTNRKHTIGYKFIIILFVCFVSFINFSNAGTYEVSINYGPYRSSVGNSSYPFFALGVPVSNSSSDITYSCYVSDYQGPSFSDNIRMYYSYMSTYGYISTYANTSKSISYSEFFYGNGVYSGIINSRYVPNYSYLNYVYLKFDSSSVSVDGTSLTFTLHCTFEGDSIISSSCPSCNPQYTSSECQSEYDLIPNSYLTTCQTDLDQCQNNTSGFNNLLNNCNNELNACNNSLTNCIQQNCPETLTGINRSSLYINNIQYPGAPTIKFTIPEEIERDQNTDEEETNIDVIGYGYDQEKMQQIVNTQYYKPTGEEMSYLVGKIADFLPLIAVALLIIRFRRVIKKIFKF